MHLDFGVEYDAFHKKVYCRLETDPSASLYGCASVARTA